MQSLDQHRPGDGVGLQLRRADMDLALTVGIRFSLEQVEIEKRCVPPVVIVAPLEHRSRASVSFVRFI